MPQSELNLNAGYGSGFARILSDTDAGTVAFQVESSAGWDTAFQVDTAAAALVGNVSPNVVATASDGTIATAGLTASLISTSAAVTGVLLQPGTADGQTVWVVNTTAYTVTFAAKGTSYVADGTSDEIAASTARQFVWSATESLWFRAG